MGSRSLIFITIIIITVVAVAVIFAITLLISGREGDNSQQPAQTEQSQTLTDPAAILATPIVYENLNLQVEADIESWVTKNSFTLLAGRSGGFLSASTTNQLWVIFGEDFKLPSEKQEGTLGLGESATVKVTGFSRILDRESAQRLLGDNLDDPKLALDKDNIANTWEYGILLVGEKVEVINQK